LFNNIQRPYGMVVNGDNVTSNQQAPLAETPAEPVRLLATRLRDSDFARPPKQTKEDHSFVIRHSSY